MKWKKCKENRQPYSKIRFPSIALAVLTLSLWVLPSRAYAQLECLEIFSRLLPEVGTSEWNRISLRYPDRPDAVMDPEYLINLHDSLTDVFIPWFKSPSSESFDEMLRRQHVILVSGRSGEHVYFGGSCRKQNVEMGLSAKPGVFLTDSSPTAIRLVKAYIDIKKHLNGKGSVKFAQVDEALEKAVNDPKNRTSRRPGAPVLPSVIEGAAISLSMPGGLPMAIWPKLFHNFGTKDGDYVHVYPKNEDKKFYLEAMGRLMGEIVSLTHAPEKDFSKLIEVLADYVDLGINAHMFLMGNYSITMSHANTILLSLGLRAISHSDLDYQGLVNDYSEFRRIFLDAVLAENPGLLVRTSSAGSNERPSRRAECIDPQAQAQFQAPCEPRDKVRFRRQPTDRSNSDTAFG